MTGKAIKTMKYFNNSASKYEQEVRQISGLIDRRASLPGQIFCSRYSKFALVGFDDLFTETFFERIAEFLSERPNEAQLTALVLDPDPNLYFYHHFGVYPLLIFPLGLSSSEYTDAMFTEPGGSQADALVYRADRLIFHSNSQSWLIYGSREFEFAIFATDDDDILQSFRSAYKDTFDIASAFETFVEPAWSGDVPSTIKEALFESYGS